MAHIKKIVLQGFKSFAKKTEIPFDKGINVIIGPNGSGKSNISDAICFALGRLSVKSMRAEKARNLIFMGSKYIKPAKEAYSEIVFDNSDRAFSLNKDEVSLKRIVKIKGASVYKINGETKTRAEVIETLGQAGIDPYGFNMVLQGQIQSVVKMHPDERRKIMGEVAGISVYEWRKEKSLKELEKTDSRLKEISTVLRERTAYLKNLEKEKSQAQRYKELQETAKRAKATIIHKKLEEKRKEIVSLQKAIEEKFTQKEKKQTKAFTLQEQIDTLTEKINQINKHTRDASGLEQNRLRDEITDLRAELEGIRVRKEGSENRRDEVERRITEMKKSIPEMEKEILELRKESPLVAKKAQELKSKKQELSTLESERKKLFSLKTELTHVKDKIDDKKSQLARTNAESDSLLNQIEELSRNLSNHSQTACQEAISSLRKKLISSTNQLETLSKKSIESEKIISVSESEISRNEGIKKKVNKIDLCPLCQSKITKDHIGHVFKDCNDKISQAKKNLDQAQNNLTNTAKEKKKLKEEITNLENKIRTAEKELLSHRTILEKKEAMKKILEHTNSLKSSLAELEAKRKSFESKTLDSVQIDERYNNKMLEIEEISSRTEEDIDTTLLYKEREIEKIKSSIARNKEDFEEIVEQIDELESDMVEKQSVLEEKEKKEKELEARFKKMFEDRDSKQKEVQETNLKLHEMQSEVRQTEEQVNYLKIGKAKLDGERETIEIDLEEFKEVELLQGSIPALEEKLRKTQSTLETIGSINMRALEVYEEIKKEYDIVKEKTDVLENEKAQIMKIIDEIDTKKRRTFMKAFKGINTLFTQNFAKLSNKGIAYLEVENKQDIFEGGVNIIVKMAKGKYFDVTSLSGGEQTLVALALLFAIQEYKPYHFYIFDEIDAALDKRNSERLASLLDQYMKTGQYVIVTHNDAIILDSNILYGVSMHDGVSKILSLKLED